MTEYEDARCRCGQRKDVAWDPAASGHFEGLDVVCHACAAVEEAEKARKDPPPGIKFYPALPADFDLEAARAAREEAMAAELGQRGG